MDSTYDIRHSYYTRTLSKNLIILNIVIYLAFFPQPRSAFVCRKSRSGCELLTNEDWGTPQPLLLTGDGEKKIIHPEAGGDSVILTSGQKVILACPGSKLLLKKKETTAVELPAYCKGGTQLSGGSGKAKRAHNFKDVSCEELPETTARVNGECFNNSTLIKVEIGFQIHNKDYDYYDDDYDENEEKADFIKLMEVCFDDNKLMAVYSKYESTPSIAGRQRGFPRTDFMHGGFYHDVKVWQLYTKKTQTETMTDLLGSRKLARRYIKENGSYYLARGHLSAKADFVYGAEQIATFYYINVAPQWQVINAGNWAALEDSLRTYVVNKNVELSVFTMPVGVAVLPDVDGVDTELYLYAEEDSHKIPVPKYYVKVVYQEKRKAALAFITVNNPYLDQEEITDHYVLCDDICEEAASWLTWRQKNIVKGYSYCCSYEDFTNAFDQYIYIPPLDVEDVL